MKRKLWLLLLCHGWIKTTTIGSDSAVTRFNTQQILQTGDRVAGFAALDGGLAIEAESIFATFDSFFPVSGGFAINYSTLVLNQDLYFNDASTWQALGSLVGNNTGGTHNINVAPSMNVIPLSSESTTGCALSSSPSFERDPLLTDAIWSVDWDNTSQYIAIGIGLPSSGGNASPSPNLFVYSWNGTSLTLITSITVGTTGVFAVAWHPINEWLAVGTDAGSNLFNYSFNGSTLTQIGTTNNNGKIWDVDWHPSGDYLAVASTSNGGNPDQVSVYSVTGVGAISATPLTQAVPIRLTPPNSSEPTSDVMAVSWNYNGTALAAGNNSYYQQPATHALPAQLQIYTFNGTTLGTPTIATVTPSANGTNLQGNSYAWNLSWNPLSSSPYNAIIAVAMGSQTNLEASGGSTTGIASPTGSSIVLYSYSGSSITELVMPAADAETLGSPPIPVNTISWRFDGTCFFMGLDRTSSNIITFGYFNSDVTPFTFTSLPDNVNWGAFSPSGTYVAAGDDSGDFVIYTYAGVISSNVFFNDVNIYLNSNVTFQDTDITFSGISSINGQGNMMTLAPTFSLMVTNGGSLLFKDVIVSGVGDDNVRCLSNSCTFSFDNATFILDSNLTFTQGIIDILGNFKITGPNQSFIYTSNQSLKIRGSRFTSGFSFDGSLTLDTNTTFSYAPTSNASNLIIMESSESTIYFNSANFIATNLQLLKGSIVVEGFSSIQGITGITFGDGISSANDCSIEIKPAANLDLYGNIFYKNV